MESNSDAVLSTMLSHEIEFHNTTKYLLSQSNVCCSAWKMAYETASTDLFDTQLKLAESEEKLRAASAELQQLKTKTNLVVSWTTRLSKNKQLTLQADIESIYYSCPLELRATRDERRSRGMQGRSRHGQARVG